ncbi:MAG: DUF805 domain-containing protein [Alphaproteobacteria bacterium]|nr:DUF805 domain-containing protein [Alphaproteobacteria bacterium]
MDFWPAVKSCLSKYATFRGRASRSEYWYFSLFCFLISIAASILDVAIFGADRQFNPISLVSSLIFLIPSISAASRRFHDLGRSYWWSLIGIIPLVGIIITLVWFCTKGTNGANRFGEDPLAGSEVAPPVPNPTS